MTQPQRIGFDGWILHVDLGELERNGIRVRLQDQPLHVLHELLSHPGELVTREQLIARLWPKGVVDFDLGLNSAVRKLRLALQDEADTPRYIQTLPRKGYRFIGTLDPPVSAPAPIATVESVSNARAAPRVRPLIYMSAAILAFLAAAIVAVPAMRTNPASVEKLHTRISPLIVPPTLAVVSVENTSVDSSDSAATIAALLRDRLADIAGLAVISSNSAETLAAYDLDIIRGDRPAKTQYVARIRTQDSIDRVRLQVDLLSSAAESTLWSQLFDARTEELDAVRDEIARRIAVALRLDADQISNTPAIDIDAYELYARAQRLIASARPSDLDEATLLLARATELDPQFARAYAALGEALLLGEEFRTKHRSTAVIVRAQRAIDRALELNPRLGEAWIQRARLTNDPTQIDEHYRRGMALAPGLDVGYAHYAKYLADQHQRGEAIEVIERARRIDPYSMTLFQSDAVMRILSRSDVAAHDAVLQEALTLRPDNAPILMQLAQSHYLWKGEFADAVRLSERALALHPQRDLLRQFVASIYLDVDDPAAVTALFPDTPPVSAMVELAQYRGDPRKAAAIAALAPITPFHAVSPVAEAVRDTAIRSGDYTSALARLAAAYKDWKAAPITIRSVAAVYAHTLILAGERDRGLELARSLLAQIEAEGEARPPHWFARERATLFAILGDDERALNELAASVAGRHIDRWWYTAKFDPLFERVRSDPRFQALNAQVELHRAEQRARLEQLRRDGTIPRERPAGFSERTLS